MLDRRGSALLIVVVVVMIVAALTSAWLVMSTASGREAGIREDKLISHYVADSGVQIALAMMVSDAPPAFPFKHMENNLAGGSCSVQVIDLGGDMISIESQGLYNDIPSEIETVVMRTTVDFALDGAIAVQINPNAEVVSDPPNTIPILFDGANGNISGFDHDIAGNVKADQSGATSALNINEMLAGALSFEIDALDPAAQVQGDPPTDNAGAYNSISIDQLVDYVRNNADTVVDITKKGGQNITSNDGSFGSPDDFKSVYVNASSVGGDFTLGGQFEGYGILVIEVEEGESLTFDMGGQAAWHGLVIYKVSGEYTAASADPINLVGGGSPDTSPHIIGGAVVYMAGNQAVFEDGSSAVRIRGNSRISYSADAIQLAVNSASSISYSMVSYRVVR